MSQGRKDDSGKLPLDLLAYDALNGTARVLQFGAEKYAPRNWEQGIQYSRVFAALQRHITAWWMGEECDPETGLSHLHHASCCVMFLQAYHERNMGAALDDRPNNGASK
ncbi:MAG: dATP/dGTP diphosphohydrolase domain-containing protein [Thiohalomonadaceae bacterium]